MKTAAQISKEAGLSSLKIASEISGESTQTLNNWLNNKPFVFYAVIEKAAKDFKMKDQIRALLEAQKNDIKEMNLSPDEINNFVFGEGDVVEQYLNDNNISEDDINLEDLRDLQHGMIAQLSGCIKVLVYQSMCGK
jgi:transcriptional regulator with XRE-family HTH domain